MLMVQSVMVDGKPVRVMKLKNQGDLYWFIFGIKKARLILDHIEDIKAFVRDIERDL